MIACCYYSTTVYSMHCSLLLSLLLLVLGAAACFLILMIFVNVPVRTHGFLLQHHLLTTTIRFLTPVKQTDYILGDHN